MFSKKKQRKVTEMTERELEWAVVSGVAMYYGLRVCIQIGNQFVKAGIDAYYNWQLEKRRQERAEAEAADAANPAQTPGEPTGGEAR